MKLAPLSLNFNFPINAPQRTFLNQIKLSQLTTDSVSFKSKEEAVKRQKAEELLGKFEELQESRKTDVDWKYSRLDKDVMDEKEVAAIVETVGAYEDLSKKLLDSCTPNSLYHKTDRQICFEIAKKQPNAAQDFLCKREFYAKDRKQHFPIYFASTTQEVGELLRASTNRKTFGLQCRDIDLINKECTREDCLDLINLTENDHELTYMLHRPFGFNRGPYSHTEPILCKLEVGDVLMVLDKFDGILYKTGILTERAEYLGGYLKEQEKEGSLSMNENCRELLNIVSGVINSKETLPETRKILYENYIAPIYEENA